MTKASQATVIAPNLRLKMRLAPEEWPRTPCRDHRSAKSLLPADSRPRGPLTGVYNASKWAVNAFSESLRQEVTTRGVRVVVIEPGATATPLASHITHPPTREAVAQFAAAMRPLQAHDVAAATVYALTQPPQVAVNEILLRSVDQQR